MKKLKIKTEMLRRNGPVIKPWIQGQGQGHGASEVPKIAL